MFVLKKLISSLLLPPLGPLLLIAGGLLVLRRRRRLGLLLAWGGVLLLLALSMPTVTDLLVRGLHKYPPVSPEAMRQAQAIVVLSGDILRHAEEYENADVVGQRSLMRLRYGVRLYRQTHLPLLLSGGTTSGGTTEAAAMAQALKHDYGIDARWVESKSFDTHDNAVFSAALLRADGIQTILLVTEGPHMRRSVMEFETAGMKVIAAPTMLAIRPPVTTPASLLPNAGALRRSAEVIHEWLGILALRLRLAGSS
jgi:uncharacterized SAM-binding protein YcdF (DUF218 family)